MPKDDDELFAQQAHMLPAQLTIIAKAALAGCKFMLEDGVRDVGAGFDDGGKWKRGHRVKSPRVKVFLPDGAYLGTYEDQYEASCMAVGVIENEISSEQAEKFEALQGLFKLREDNEPR